MCLWIGIWNESQRNVVKKKARECRTEYYFCIYSLGKNMTWITRPGRITDQGMCINETCYLLAKLLNEGGKYIREIITNEDYWLDSVRNTDQCLQGLSKKISGIYTLLPTCIPYETTLLWCIYIKESHVYTGVPAVLEYVVRNTSMVAYLVGDEIYPSWNSHVILLAVEFLNTVRRCVHLTVEFAEEVRKYYLQEDTITLIFEE